MKKYLALMLVLALMVAVAAPAFAADADGTVKFEGDGITIVPDPDPDDEDPEWKPGTMTGLDFGIHDVEDTLDTAISYDSTVWAGLSQEDIDNGDTPTNGKDYTGITITNTYVDGWNVSVEIAGFYVGGISTDPDRETLKGYTLTLMRDTSVNLAEGTNPPSKIEDTVALTAGDSKVVLGASVNTGIGKYGYSYSGTLDAPAGSAAAGDAVAVMTWNSAQTPV